MNKTAMRIALEVAMRATPYGKAQQFVRRAVSKNHGYQRPARRKAKVTQIWSSPRAAREFLA